MIVRTDTTAAKSKSPHPKNGNHRFYFYSELYKLSYCLYILVSTAKLEKKEIECNLISLDFSIILTIGFAQINATDGVSQHSVSRSLRG